MLIALILQLTPVSAQIFGWNIHLGYSVGYSVGILPWDIRFGQSVWIFGLDIRLGNSVWIFARNIRFEIFSSSKTAKAENPMEERHFRRGVFVVVVVACLLLTSYCSLLTASFFCCSAYSIGQGHQTTIMKGMQQHQHQHKLEKRILRI